jgi:hypothetical protein
MIYQDDLNQVATYWPPGENDGFGGLTYLAPFTINCRWQDKSVLFRDSDGREVTSDAIVYVGSEVQNKGMLYLGTENSLDPAPGAKEIRAVQKSPDLDNFETLIKVML